MTEPILHLSYGAADPTGNWRLSTMQRTDGRRRAHFLQRDRLIGLSIG